LSQLVRGHRLKSPLLYRDLIDLTYIGSDLVNASGLLAFFRRLNYMRLISGVLVGKRLGLLEGVRIYKPAFRLVWERNQKLSSKTAQDEPNFDASDPEKFEEILRKGARFFASLKPGLLTEDIIERSDPLEVRRSTREVVRRRIENDFRSMFIQHGPNKVRAKLLEELDKLRQDQKNERAALEDREADQLTGGGSRTAIEGTPGKVLPFRTVSAGAKAVRNPENHFDQFKD